MSFDSLAYLLFLPIVTGIHWLCPGRWRWIVLLVASYAFYMSWNAALAGLMLGVTAAAWLSGLAMDKAKHAATRRIWLTGTLLVCLSMLGVFKYVDFIGESVAALMGRQWTAWQLILPVGISFYTFQAMSYVMDVYRGKLAPEKHFGYFALYVSFFPQLVAGPIERTERLLPQLRATRTLCREDARAGVQLLISGFFRKVVIADSAAVFVNRIYAMVDADGGAVLAATLLFGLQIYCDFAGYSEIAAGSARLLGIRLMRNFDRPYGADSLRSFWRRWHISLSTWFTDYLYIPLGGNRKGLTRQIAATLAVFLVSGLWHGAQWHFVVWGLLHGLMMTVELLLRKLRTSPAHGKHPLAVLLTFCAVSFAWIFFRADTLQQAFAFVGRIFSPWNGAVALQQLGVSLADGLQLGLTLLCMPLLHRLSSGLDEGGKAASYPDMTYVLGVMVIALAWLIRLAGDGASTFIYFQF